MSLSSHFPKLSIYGWCCYIPHPLLSSHPPDFFKANPWHHTCKYYGISPKQIFPKHNWNIIVTSKKKKKSVPLQYDQISILYTFYIFPLSSWRKKWQPTPVFWPGESHGQGSLVSYSPWGHKESDTTERLNHHYHLTIFKIVFQMVI